MLFQKKFIRKNIRENLWSQLVLENSFFLGLHPQLTSKKTTKYLLGTRLTLEIFKLYELRYLLLKIYPFIHLLFQNPRVNSIKSKIQTRASKLKLLSRTQLLEEKKRKKKIFKKKFVFSFKSKPTPPQILFATITEAFSEIILQAAHICNMPHHKKRWTNGTITAAISNVFRNDSWDYTQDLTHKENVSFFNTFWGTNKENKERTKEKKTYHTRSKWPSLVIIPDISNNEMILTEIKKIGIPVIGLVNSHCSFEIDYPIFAQDQTHESVHFFCHFLSTLIAKEMAYTQHKHYVLQKMPLQRKKKRKIFGKRHKKQKPKSAKKLFHRNILDKLDFRELVKQQKMNKALETNLFFQIVVNPKRKASRSYSAPESSLPFRWHPYKHALLLYLLAEHRLKKKKTRSYYFAPKHVLRFAKRVHRVRDLSFPWTQLTVKDMEEYSDAGQDTENNDSADKRNKRIYEATANLLPWPLRDETPLKNIIQSQVQKDLITYCTVEQVMFFEEQKIKVSSKERGFLLFKENNYVWRHLLRAFLWLPHKINVYWKRKTRLATAHWFTSNLYYWRSLQGLHSDFKWQQNHKYILAKALDFNNVKHRHYALQNLQKPPWKRHINKKYRRYQKKKNFISQKKSGKFWADKIIERLPEKKSSAYNIKFREITQIKNDNKKKTK